MKSVGIREAKNNLSRLVAEAAKGEAFVITRAGKPLVKVLPFDAPSPGKTRRFGFMKGRIKVPDDFDQMDKKKSPACSARDREVVLVAQARVKRITLRGDHALMDRERLARS